MSAKQVTIKCKFQNELRRFQVPTTIENADFRKIFMTLFPNIPATFSLKYQDDEGDWIFVTTDYELEEAIRISLLQTPPIFRVVVSLEEPKPWTVVTEKKLEVTNSEPAEVEVRRSLSTPLTPLTEPQVELSLSVKQLVPVTTPERPNDTVDAVETVVTTVKTVLPPRKKVSDLVSELSDKISSNCSQLSDEIVKQYLPLADQIVTYTSYLSEQTAADCCRHSQEIIQRTAHLPSQMSEQTETLANSTSKRVSELSEEVVSSCLSIPATDFSRSEEVTDRCSKLSDDIFQRLTAIDAALYDSLRNI